MKSKKHIMREEVRPLKIKQDSTISDFLNDIKDTSFQARRLGRAFVTWQRMLRAPKCLIFFGLAGAMVPAGLREVIVSLIDKRLIDIIVTTGANIFHDVYETMGFEHYKSDSNPDDVLLRRHRLDRIFDVVADDRQYITVDNTIMKFVKQLDKRPYSTREFFYLFGGYLSSMARCDGILTSAARQSIPIYCPAVVDSGYGLSMVYLSEDSHPRFLFDLVKDTDEVVSLSIGESYNTAEILIGGGVPKNFIQQGPNVALESGSKSQGYRYCIQITTDSPQWGGLSGCTFEEATTWHKVDPAADKVMLYCDATIALPLLVTGLHQVKAYNFRKYIPEFDMRQELKVTFKTNPVRYGAKHHGSASGATHKLSHRTNR